MDEQQLRQLAKEPAITIKFAGLLPGGGLSSDAFDAYEGFFEDLPFGWILNRTTQVEPRGDNWAHAAWIFSHDEVEDEILAVSHETGVEFLLMGLAAPLIVAGVTEFVKWSWARWNARRANKDKVLSSFVVEAVRDEFPDGRIRTTVRCVATPPVGDDGIAALMARVHRQALRLADDDRNLCASASRVP